MLTGCVGFNASKEIGEEQSVDFLYYSPVDVGADAGNFSMTGMNMPVLSALEIFLLIPITSSKSFKSSPKLFDIPSLNARFFHSRFLCHYSHLP